eukprot:CAMPEP_0185561558 /NCGR_PEP_ID=MMETSP1381-20130426/59442_1 /TAXON_ID=298111 /ORGANISM="Pavlova sp., Strain CCMP459" /LENGTH=149 /DNA_ID=CAMNT_0028175339 /DNA_START=42 /DNA_END=491 /DNA_ORIENTATION=+
MTVPIVFHKPCDSEESVREALSEMARLREDNEDNGDASGEAGVEERTCSTLLNELNTQFGTFLELYVLKSEGLILTAEEVLERVRAVDLDGTGFTIETIICHMGDEDESEGCEVRERRVLFNRECSNVDEIEDALCQLLAAAAAPTVNK